MIIGCYDMHIYCEGKHTRDGTLQEFQIANEVYPAMFTGRTKRDCIQQAKKAGWTFKRNGKTFCPHCSKPTHTPT